MSELKPCPFCGEELAINRYSGVMFSTGCMSCDFESCQFEDMEDLLRVINNRHTPQPQLTACGTCRWFVGNELCKASFNPEKGAVEEYEDSEFYEPCYSRTRNATGHCPFWEAKPKTSEEPT